MDQSFLGLPEMMTPKRDFKIKVEKIEEDSLELIPSTLPSLKIQITPSPRVTRIHVTRFPLAR